MAGEGQMDPMSDRAVRYSILDPTGNITALVESHVAVGEQPSVAKQIMRRHTDVEQVGYVRPAVGEAAGMPVDAELRMAGGEFCGNATMCAAALHLLRRGETDGMVTPTGPDGPHETVWMRVSGASRPVEVRLRQEASGDFSAGVHMPPALAIEDTELAYGEMRGTLPVVRMEGISHIVIEPSSAFACLKDGRLDAERAVRVWCDSLGTDGLGLMFLEGEGAERRMTPLVFVPGSGTVFWENSCASGSSAVGMLLSSQEGAPVSLTLHEPGGSLRVESDPARGETWLFGTVRLLESRKL